MAHNDPGSTNWRGESGLISWCSGSGPVSWCGEFPEIFRVVSLCHGVLHKTGSAFGVTHTQWSKGRDAFHLQLCAHLSSQQDVIG